jgi:hypothetical protein
MERGEIRDREPMKPEELQHEIDELKPKLDDLRRSL